MDAQMCNNAEMAVIGIIVPLQILQFDALFLPCGDVWFSPFWGKMCSMTCKCNMDRKSVLCNLSTKTAKKFLIAK